MFHLLHKGKTDIILIIVLKLIDTWLQVIC